MSRVDMRIGSIFKDIRSSAGEGEKGKMRALTAELEAALRQYWTIAERILKGSGITVVEPPADFFTLESNFFSALFLYSYMKAGIPSGRRVFYSCINQCLRGMVTGCDNILDDEYKKTLDTDLPQDACRFRSIIDIMVSDRVLFELLLKAREDGDITYGQAVAASSATLRALSKSGAQEASEEGGVRRFLPPGDILSSVHHYKTGILFQAPWAVPSIIESTEARKLGFLKDALYDIGMGCQILDDMVDLSSDLSQKRHNYAASLIYHGSGQAAIDSIISSGRKDAILKFPKARQTASAEALTRLKRGLNSLFTDDDRAFVAPATTFLIHRIRAERFVDEKGDA